MQTITPYETEEQQALFTWAALQTRVYPELELMFAIPNGGLRHKKTAHTLKAEGVKAGVPDIFLPAPHAGYNGMFIEMKRQSGGKLSDAQKILIKRLEMQGYFCVVAKGWEEAAQELRKYLSNNYRRNKA